MLLLAYSILGILLALLGAAVWRLKLTQRLIKRHNLDVDDPEKMARNAGLFLLGLGLYAVLCGYFAQQTTTKNGQIMVMILFVVGAQVAMVIYMTRLR